MSVYTAIDQHDLVAFLDAYELGSLRRIQGISDGIENSNFFLDTSCGQFVLTIFERIAAADVKFCLAFTEHLDLRGLPCPRPVRLRNGNFLASLSNKPAAIVQRLPGKSVDEVTVELCCTAGDWLGRMHCNSDSFTAKRDNSFSPAWLAISTDALRSVFTTTQKSLLKGELAHQACIDYSSLPKGLIHGDLFRDNVLFTRGHLSGVIDFYYACYDTLLLDLAITVNDWCIDSTHNLQTNRLNALLEAYHRQRPLTQREFILLPELLRYAALRFWVSRSFDHYFPRQGEMIQTKNPQVFETLLRNLSLQKETLGKIFNGLYHTLSH